MAGLQHAMVLVPLKGFVRTILFLTPLLVPKLSPNHACTAAVPRATPGLCCLQAILPRGADPAADARDRQLQKLATRGVVLLFNAVSKAQKQKQEAEAAGGKAAAKAAKAAKTGIFAELKAGAKAAASMAAPAAGAAGAGRKSSGGAMQQEQEGGGGGWEVLGEGFPGLTGGVKMKDWDKAADSGDEGPGAALAGSDDDGDDDSDGGADGAW